MGFVRDIIREREQEEYNLKIEMMKDRLKTIIEKFEFKPGIADKVVRSQDILDNIDFIFMTEDK